MKHITALVGRPNVGKSTLFNRLIQKRKSLVSPISGVTRDRVMGCIPHTGLWICDTGGLDFSPEGIQEHLQHQVELALACSPYPILVVDGLEGLHPLDVEIATWLKRRGLQFYVAVNKCDVYKHTFGASEFYKLGGKELILLSAEHGTGITDLIEKIQEVTPTQKVVETQDISFAFVGKPNVGKSSLLNQLLKEERSLVHHKPGTTRDVIDGRITFFEKKINILDTAGIRRHAKTEGVLEYLGMIQTHKAIEEAQVLGVVLDATSGLTSGDARIAGYAFETRKPIMFIVNKWDLLDTEQKEVWKKNTSTFFPYLSYAPTLFVSAKTGLHVSHILPLITELYEECGQRVATSKVSSFIRDLQKEFTPPLRKNRQGPIKLYYGTQVSATPPQFVLFCSHPEELHFSYKRFVENRLRKQFEFHRVPINVIYRSHRSDVVE